VTTNKAERISISFRKTWEKDIQILNFLETKRNKSIYIKELIEKDMENITTT